MADGPGGSMQEPNPGALDIASLAIRDGLPVFGVFFLGWDALSVIALYWLDGLLWFWGLVPPIVVLIDREDPALFAKYRGARKLLLMGIVALFSLLLMAVMMAIPGAMILAQIGHHVGNPLASLLANRSLLVSAGAMTAAALAQGLVSALRGGGGISKLNTRQRGEMVLHRTVLAGMLAFIVIGGWTLKLFTVVVAVLFAFSELYPERYLRLIGSGPKGPDK